MDDELRNRLVLEVLEETKEMEINLQSHPTASLGKIISLALTKGWNAALTPFPESSND